MNARNETVIYLDQNKWIDLARAYHKHKLGKQYERVFKIISSKLLENKIILPLDSARYIETYKAKNKDRRIRLAQVMGVLSQGWSLAPSDYFISIELQNALANIYGEIHHCSPRLLGKGVGFAFGKAMDLYNNSKLQPPLDKLFVDFVESPQGVISFLVGHDQVGDEGILRYQEGSDEYAKKIEEFREIAKPYSKAIRNRSYAAEMTIILESEIRSALTKYNKSFSDYLGLGKAKLMDFWSDVPSIDTEMALSTERMENYSRAIFPNDMADIGAW